MIKGDKNTTWEWNHAKIRDSYIKLIQSLERKPTYDEVSKDTNLSYKTIQKHADTLKFEPHKHSLRILTDDVMMSIANSAMDGSHGSQKLWMQIIEGWSERTVLEHEGEINLNDARKKLIEKLTNKRKE